MSQTISVIQIPDYAARVVHWKILLHIAQCFISFGGTVRSEKGNRKACLSCKIVSVYLGVLLQIDPMFHVWCEILGRLGLGRNWYVNTPHDSGKRWIGFNHLLALCPRQIDLKEDACQYAQSNSTDFSTRLLQIH